MRHERTAAPTCRGTFTVLAIALAVGLCGTAEAQDVPRASVLVGVGNPFGWIGAQVDTYLARGRVSAFVGVGYMPNVLNDEGSGAAGAGGIRGFTRGTRHRGLLELSFSALSNTVTSISGPGGTVTEKTIDYGPGVALGYQFIGEEGLTFLVTGGVGLGSQGFEPEGSRLQPVLGIGIGYSVR